MSRKIWVTVEAVIPGGAQEAIEYGMMEAGALGTEARDVAGRVAVTGYFAGPVEEKTIRKGLWEALKIYNLAPDALASLEMGELADADWLAEWKKDWRETEIGRFIVAPPWIDSALAVSDGKILIRINPGMAFGTGTHETTRLCLKAIEKYFNGGSFLDVGTGTGILAIAAAKMFGDARIEARDTDAEAVEIAKENAQLNEIACIDFRVGGVDEQTASADLVCANLTAPVIVELLPALLGVTCGSLVLSGILESQREMVEQRITELSALVREIKQDGEWIALVV